jgi:hypothetical protein
MSIMHTHIDRDDRLLDAATRAGPDTTLRNDIEAGLKRLARQAAAHCRGPHTGIH